MVHFPGWDVLNAAVSGQDGGTIVTAEPLRTHPAYAAAHTKNVFWMWGEGTNELAGGATAAAAYQHTVDTCLAAKARGFKVCVGTVLPCGTHTAGQNTARLAMNTSIRTNWATFADAIADVALIPQMANTADTTYYADTIHPTDAGHDLCANDPTRGWVTALTPLMGAGGGGAGVATHLEVVQEPAGFALGSSCTVPAKVAVKDALGNVVTDFNGTIQVMGLASNLTGPTILPVFNGYATFRRLAAATLGALTLAFSSTGLAGANSAPLVVAAATGTFYRAAELPRITPALPAWMAQQASGAADVTVTATSAADLQAKFNTDAALTGAAGNLNRDYLIPDGVDWVANIVWPNRDPSLTGWMRVRCASDLPAPAGTRVTPAALVGKGILETATTGAVFKTDDPNVGPQVNIPHHYALAGFTIRAQAGLGTGFWLLGWGTGTNQDAANKVPHHFVLDRCVLDGGSEEISHAVYDSVGWHIIRDCAFLNIHSNADSDGGHAITAINGPGPALIENNTLQCSGVICIIGGGDPNVAEQVPSDFTIRGNLFTRDPAWNRAINPLTGWKTKNNFDLKNFQRVLTEGNIYENCWTDGQNGSLTNYKSVNQGGFAPWCGGTDLVSRKNCYRNANEAFSIAGRPEPTKECVPFSRYVFEDSLAFNIPSHIRIGGGGTFDGVINHLTWFAGVAKTGFTAYVGDDLDVQTRFTLTNVLGAPGQNQGVLGQTTFPPAVFSQRLPGSLVTKNVIANPAPGYSQSNANFPTGNFIDGVTTASVGFTSIDETAWDTLPIATVALRFALLSTSPYHGAATDGTDIGADIPGLIAALGGVSVASALEMATEAIGGSAGLAFPTQPAVEIVDQFGVRLTSSTAVLTANLYSGTGALLGIDTRWSPSPAWPFDYAQCRHAGREDDPLHVTRTHSGSRVQ
jgi:hypothetical protein